MSELGRLEDLPLEYREALASQHLVPLWPSLRALLPPEAPRPRTRFTHWPYQALRSLLLRAGALTPIEQAERRVLVLANPGYGPESMQASSAIYLGMQLLLPGEWAPAHRHTPNAVRMVVEGEGAWTTVDGERCSMRRGDLILTPTGTWHEHGHDGTQPVIWLDVLDLPLVHYLEASYHQPGAHQQLQAGHAERSFRRSGVVPSPVFERARRRYPLLRYPWVEVREALLELAADRPGEPAVQVAYVNPETGEDAENILGFSALLLRPGKALELPPRSPALVLHVVEGAAEVEAGGVIKALAEADTACVPGLTPLALRNARTAEPTFLFLADESPLHRKLGLLETRPRGDHR